MVTFVKFLDKSLLNRGTKALVWLADTAACTDVKNVSFSESLPDGVELGMGCTKVSSPIVIAWFQAPPGNRRAAAYHLAAFAVSGTCVDGRGVGIGLANPACRCGCLAIQKVAQHCRVLHYKTVC
jgi:hypothetical protein